MTRPDVIDTDGEVVETRATPATRPRVGQPELALVAALLRYANHLPGCTPTGASSCSCGLTRAAQAAEALGCPAPTLGAPPPVVGPDVEAALFGGALGGLLGTLIRKSNTREEQPLRPARDRRADHPDDSPGERARTVVRRRRSR